MKYSAVIFDLDGTLLNTLEDLCDSVNVVMREYGWEPHSLEQIRKFVGNGIGKLMERSVPGGRENPKYEKALADFREYYTGHCRIKTKPYEGVIGMMEELKRRGYRMAIVSNKNDQAVKELDKIYFSQYTVVAVGDRKGYRRKPEPDLVHLAMDELGVQPEDTVYVGDSEVDYATAKNSGLDCILVSWGFRDREVLEQFGTVIADEWRELLSRL